MECMQKQPGCRKLVFSSSATVYGEPDKLPLDESSSVGVGITNPYGVCVRFFSSQCLILVLVVLIR